MAKKNLTQAERRSASAATQKKKSSAAKKQQSDMLQPESSIPSRAVAAVVYLLLFILFVVTSFREEGLVLLFIRNIVLGLFGIVSFYLAIPGFFYLFLMQIFGGKKSVFSRSCCTLGFVYLCGCISHLSASAVGLGSGFLFIKNLYTGGILGTTGGLLCGLLSELLLAAFGRVFSYILLFLSALIALLASFQITIPNLIKAIENRPRIEQDLDEPEIDPAEVVVNHIAKKHIAHVENRRRMEAERAQQQAEQASMQQQEHAKMTKNLIEEIQDDFETEPVPDSKIVRHPREHTSPDVEIIPIVPEKPVEQAPLSPKSDIDFPSKPSAITDSLPDKMPELITPIIENKKVTAKEASESAAQVAQEIMHGEKTETPVYCFPPIDLLASPKGNSADGTQEMRDNTKRLNETLASFKIEAHISNVTRGPSVTRYEVELEKGVRLNKLTTMADDIALSLGASGVRIAPVPGKISVVGIEVPNIAVTTVSLKEVIHSPEFNRAKSKSSFAVGKDIAGNCIIGNIAKLPHMLIAGTTGSGKSVCMNSIIISLLYKASPENVKLIMVDPKMVELGIYNGIPHLLIPVVTDPKKAAGSLQWAVTEMMRRYRSMSDAGVRDLESYNSMIDGGELDGEHLAQVVVIIDELADLMLVAAKEVEESICRIAQMGRAAGIHLIIATQRPSADVITGLMKANIPSRIAFAVASAMESRIILDTTGAEKLVGKGDMLFAPIGSGKPVRVQGCFVSDGEVEAVTNYVKGHYSTTYDQQVMDEIEKKAQQTGNKSSGHATASDPDPSAAELDGDEMLPAAVEVILETKQASVSMLQRRLKLGYARAARIVDEMEERGIVGPFMGSKPRQILISKEQWEQMKSGQTLITEGEESIEDGTAETPDSLIEES